MGRAAGSRKEDGDIVVSRPRPISSINARYDISCVYVCVCVCVRVRAFFSFQLRTWGDKGHIATICAWCLVADLSEKIIVVMPSRGLCLPVIVPFLLPWCLLGTEWEDTWER